jgi:hypothetical protein
MIEQTRTANATKPTVRPTAPPVPSPLLFLLVVIPLEIEEAGGMVGVTVTVLTWPVTVSREVTGVGVHVVEPASDEVVVADPGLVIEGAVEIWNMH